MAAAGGDGIALRVDHLEPGQVRDLALRIDEDHGRLDVLVNDIFDGGRYAQFGTTLWEHSLPDGLRMLRIGIDTHVITSHFLLPLLIRRPGGLVVEMTDGTAEYNAAYRHREGFYYDLVKAAVQRMTTAQAYELAPHQASAVAVTPGWMRSEDMLDFYEVTEATWRQATAKVPHLCISSSPTYPGARSRRSRPTRTWRAGRGRGARRAASWPASTGSPTPTAPSPTAGGTWLRSRTATSPPTTAGTGRPRHLVACQQCNA